MRSRLILYCIASGILLACHAPVRVLASILGGICDLAPATLKSFFTP
jgi:hypothetical protein